MIQFLTPLGAPDIEDDYDFADLPSIGKEFSEKPLVRNISEFKFWYIIKIGNILPMRVLFLYFALLYNFWIFLYFGLFY